MEKRKRGFTIIELIVVMTIILILAGLITGAAQKAKQRAMVAQAKSMIVGLETALGMFQTDLGGYPDSGNANLVTALTTVGGTYTIGTAAGNAVTTTAGWAGPYMNFKQGDLISGQIVDPWGDAYVYGPGTNHTGSSGPDYTGYIDIYSQGPDKSGDGTDADDITNWKR